MGQPKNSWKKGIPRPQWVKDKISKSHTGVRPSKEARLKMSLAKLGKVTWNTGKKRTPEAKLKNSLAHRGSNGSGWRGGLTSLIRLIRRGMKYREWRMAVFTRDKFTCIWGDSSHKSGIQADHIIQFALLLRQYNIQTVEQAENCKALWNINNGRTLCIDCHKQTDTYLNKGKRYLKNYELQHN